MTRPQPGRLRRTGSGQQRLGTQQAGARRTSTSKALIIEGKGAPGGELLSEALNAMAELAQALLAAKKRGGGHAFKIRQPEVRFDAPPAGRGAATWSVRLRVPAFVTARDVELAAAAVGAERPLARKAVLWTSANDAAEHPGRDRQPGTIRRTRAGAVSQHRARDLL